MNAQYSAGAVRQIGRLALMLSCDQIVSVIQHKIDTALTNLSNIRLRVHIMTGLGGSTGSGIFLDVCYIVQKIINDIRTIIITPKDLPMGLRYILMTENHSILHLFQ